MTTRMVCAMNRFVMVLALVLVVPAGAQMAMPASGATAFKDTSGFKPPSGAKVAIIEFEDLECPLCARVSPNGARGYEPLPHSAGSLRLHHSWTCVVADGCDLCALS